MAKMVAAVKTTVLGGWGDTDPGHSSLTKTTTEQSQETCRQPMIGYQNL